jgi:hypothetical protein
VHKGAPPSSPSKVSLHGCIPILPPCQALSDGSAVQPGTKAAEHANIDLVKPVTIRRIAGPEHRDQDCTSPSRLLVCSQGLQSPIPLYPRREWYIVIDVHCAGLGRESGFNWWAVAFPLDTDLVAINTVTILRACVKVPTKGLKYSIKSEGCE